MDSMKHNWLRATYHRQCFVDLCETCSGLAYALFRATCAMPTVERTTEPGASPRLTLLHHNVPALLQLSKCVSHGPRGLVSHRG
jgi:hypothetical protein